MSTDPDWRHWPAGVGRRILDQIDSTNAEAVRLAPTLEAPEWILALRQTAGRGRRGRAWTDPEGNFSATYVMRPSEPPAQVALRSFVAALALFDALVAASGRSDGLALKWPNDVLLNGGKVAGILLESTGADARIAHLAIGFGVNLLQAPDASVVGRDATRPVSLMFETGARVTPQEFLALLAPAYARWEYQFTSHGFAPVRTTWLTRAARIGETITARTGKHEITGTFQTVDEAGNLVLSTAQGRQAIPAADVFF